MNDVIKDFKQELIAEIMRVYELEYPTASGDMDEFYHDVLNIIRNLRYADSGETNDKLKLAMRAGAYAIRNNEKYQSGWFKSGEEVMSWSVVEKILLCTAEGLDPDEYEVLHE